MLVIRSTSWHYRLWALLREDYRPRPKNLCRYFWALFFLVTIPSLIFLGAMIGVGFLVFWTINEPITATIVFLSIWLGATLITGFVLLLGWGIPKLVERSSNRRAKKQSLRGTQPPKEPSVVVEYIKARKARACPLIQVDFSD